MGADAVILWLTLGFDLTASDVWGFPLSFMGLFWETHAGVGTSFHYFLL